MKTGKVRPKNRQVVTEYLYLEDHSDEGGKHMIPCFYQGSEYSILQSDLEHIGVSTELQELFNQHEQGYYKIEYTITTYRNGDWETGYYNCPTVDEVIYFAPSLKSNLMEAVYNARYMAAVVRDVFLPAWEVQYLYGNVYGPTLHQLFLPHALYRRFFPSKEIRTLLEGGPTEIKIHRESDYF